MGKKNKNEKVASAEKVMKQRFFGVSALIIILNIAMAGNIKVLLITFALMLINTLVFTRYGRVVAGTWFGKEKWRTLNVSQKTTFFRIYIALPLALFALYLHMPQPSGAAGDAILNYIFPPTEDISASAMLTKLRLLFSNNLPAVVSSISLYVAYLFITGSIVKNIQVGMSGKLLRRIRNSEEAKWVLSQMKWDQFEKILQKFFEQKGYKAILTATGADGGVDILLEKNARREMVQAKHWKTNRVGVAIVREIFGVVQAEGFHRGFIITSGLFTQEAREFSDKVNGKVILIDGDLLIEIIKGDSNFDKSTNTGIHQVPTDSSTCELCGGQMMLRSANKKTFWGCDNFPDCRNTKEV